MAKPSSKVIAGAGKKSSANRSIAVPSAGRGGYESVSVRPIDNGYIVSRSTDKGYSEVFSPTKPKIEVPKCAPKGKK
jgi:hypothetical protein